MTAKPRAELPPGTELLPKITTPSAPPALLMRPSVPP